MYVDVLAKWVVVEVRVWYQDIFLSNLLALLFESVSLCNLMLISLARQTGQ